MKAICYVPSLTTALRVDLGAVINATGVGVSYCTSESEVIAVAQGQSDCRGILLVTDENQANLLQHFNLNYPNSFVIVLIKSHLHSLSEDIRYCLPAHSFVAATDHIFDPRDLGTVIQKVKTREIFGLERYLQFGTEIFSERILCDADKVQTLAKVERFVLGLGENLSNGRFTQYASRIRMMLDELVLNAIFHANPRFKNVDRSSALMLKEDEAVTVRWAYDGFRFAYSVTDQFGVIEKKHVMSYLDRTFYGRTEDGQKSAGLGLQFVFDRIQSFVINVCPRTKTEVICLLKFEKKMKDIDSAVRSLHFFCTENL
jgi:hypothetical protein